MSPSRNRLYVYLLGLAALTLSGQSPQARILAEPRNVSLTAEIKQNWELGRGLDDRHALRILREAADAAGGTLTLAQQHFQGLRVLGGELILHRSHSGKLETAADALVRNFSLDTNPTLQAAEALAITRIKVAPRGDYTAPPTTELVVYPVRRLIPRAGIKHPANAADFEEIVDRHELAYLVHVEIEQGADTRHENLLVHANTGEILQHWSSLHTAAQEGVGSSTYSGTVKLGTNSVPGGFELRDLLRVGNYTNDMGNTTSGNGFIYTNSVNEWGDGANHLPGSSGNSLNGQTAAVDAHYGMQVTWDFLNRILGRNGIDGSGRSVFSRVHYSTDYDNAFWSDACFCMTFGDGSVFKTLTALDVAAHEMAHGVTSSTANLAYYGESGGLNEANSDIFGTMVEFYARGANGQGSVIPDSGGNWTMGEQLVTSRFPNPLRYLYKPSLDGRSPDAWSPALAGLDVHYSSGPMNRAFFFLSQGASADAASPYRSAYLPAGMKGLGNDKAFRIWWRTLSTRLTSTSNYLAARTGAIAAASELYGPGSPEEAAVWNAFAAINVGSPWTSSDSTIPVVVAKEAGTSGTLTFTAIASDNVGVTKVEYYVDGALKGSVTASPYPLACNSISLLNGTHSLVAKAYDAAGNVGTSAALAFLVNNVDATAPTVVVKLTSAGGSFTCTATASDNVGVTRVEYFVDGLLKGSATIAPYTLAFSSSTLANGVHSLIAKGYDAAGNVGTSAAVSFILDTMPPVVIPKIVGTVGTLAFTATASDNLGVSRVEYYVDGVLKGSATASPYALAFNSTTVANGAHSLVAKAYDAVGNIGSSVAVPFTVNNKDTTAPSVVAKLTSAGGSFTCTATASDNVGVTRVEYFVDGLLKGSATIAPYTLVFSSSTLGNGVHSLIAKGYDAAGNVGTSAAVSFLLDTMPPVVTPKVVGTSGTLAFTATASDNIGVTKVEYYVDGALKGSVTASPYPLACNSISLLNGTHSLVAKSYDAAGNVGTSAALAFLVNNVDATAPTVVAKLTSAAGSFTCTATASDNVGVTRVEYFVDGLLKGSATIAPYTLAFSSSTLANGVHSLIAKGYDAAGNVGTSAAVSFILDTMPPVVTAKIVGTAGTLAFTATASDNLGVTRVEYYVDGVLKGSATASPYTLAFNSATLADGDHTLVAKAFDAAGNVGASPSVLFKVANSVPSSTYSEVELNDSVSTANKIPDATSTIRGALSTGLDVDTFAISLVVSQSVQLTLTSPAGMAYGMRLAPGITNPTAQGIAYIQVYSLTGQGSSSPYTIAIRR